MFFFWPIGHDERPYARIPHVTLAILAINMLVFLFTYVMHGSTSDRIDDALQRVFAFHIEHPYTQPGRSFNEHVTRETRQEVDRQASFSRHVTKEPTHDVLAQQQAELDDLIAALGRSIESASTSYERRLGFIPTQPTATSLLSSMFTHAGWQHLIGNMFMLYLSAPFLEGAFRGKLFAVIYLIGGAVAALLFKAMNPEFDGPLIGASGAVFAVVGAFLVRFHSSKIKFFVCLWAIKFFSRTMWAPAVVVLPLMILKEYTDAMSGQVTGVAHWAHVGGFAFGFAAALAVKFAHLEKQPVEAPTIADASDQDALSTKLRRGIAARDAGKLDLSRIQLTAASRSAPKDPEPHIELFRTHTQLDDLVAAEKHATTHLRLLVAEDGLDRAAASFDEILPTLPGYGATAPVLLALGQQAERAGHRTRAVVLYERLARYHPQHPSAAIGLGNAGELDLHRGEPAAAVMSYRRAVAIPLDEQVAAQLRARLNQIATHFGIPIS